MKTHDIDTQIASAIDAVSRGARSGVVRNGRGGSVPRMFSTDGQADPVRDDDVVARIYGPDDVLDTDVARGIDHLERIIRDLTEVVLANAGQSRQPGPPVSVLMHGPSDLAMSVVAHLVARRARAELIHLYASTVVPSSSGGSQPIVAPAVNRARERRPSVLFIDQLQTLVADRHDIQRQRAFNDLLGESLRSGYGPAPIVLAAFASVAAPPRGLTGRFGHLLYVGDLTDQDMPVPGPALRAIDRGVRTAPQHTVAQRAYRPGPSRTDSAA